jgi:hypothetical protein
MKRALVVFTILPYLILCLGVCIGHLVLCLMKWKRPAWGGWRDLVFFYKRFLNDILILRD